MTGKQNKRILYVQYTNPANYPPLENSSRILANDGWNILFLGMKVFKTNELFFSSKKGVVVKLMDNRPLGWGKKLHYLKFCLWVLWKAICWQPRWLYVSELTACPAVLLLIWIPGLRVIYHEHDSPNERKEKRNRMNAWNFMLWARKRLALRAICNVLPNEERLRLFRKQVGHVKKVLCVWNCPSRSEVALPRNHANNNFLRVIYAGSIGPARPSFSFLA